MTAIDRRLIRDMDDMRLVSARHIDPFQQALRASRLQKLARMNLATHVGGDSWRLDADLATTLRRIGERGDIIRTMQRDLSARNLERASADRVIYDPAAADARPIVGRVLSRGLADEHADRHYLLIDGIDGRAHYTPLGKGEAVGAIPLDAVVRITPRGGGIRAADRTIVAVAAAHSGRYTIDAHLKHDPSATESFAETHVRRLEAIRRVMRSLEREPDGAWIITPDHLEKVERFEARQLRERPVSLEMLSVVPLESLVVAEAATWLDRDLIAGTSVPIRDAGFGRDVNAARELRRQWLIAEQLAEEQDGRTVYRRNLLAALQRRELLRVGARLSEELRLPFTEAKTGDQVQGRLVRAVEMTSGRHALIERSRDFTLVPWRDMLERHVGKSVAGIVRESGISWTIGRQRSGPSIS